MFALLCPFRLNSIMRRGACKYNNNIILCIGSRRSCIVEWPSAVALTYYTYTPCTFHNSNRNVFPTNECSISNIFAESVV